VDLYYVNVNVSGFLSVKSKELKGIRQQQKTTNERLAALEGRVGLPATETRSNEDE